VGPFAFEIDQAPLINQSSSLLPLSSPQLPQITIYVSPLQR